MAVRIKQHHFSATPGNGLSHEDKRAYAHGREKTHTVHVDYHRTLGARTIHEFLLNSLRSLRIHAAREVDLKDSVVKGFRLDLHMCFVPSEINQKREFPHGLGGFGLTQTRF